MGRMVGRAGGHAGHRRYQCKKVTQPRKNLGPEKNRLAAARRFLSIWRAESGGRKYPLKWGICYNWAKAHGNETHL